jgi:hypothetical protein
MAGNATPQFTRQATATPSVLITANLAPSDGSGGTIGTNMFLVMTADANNGSFVEYVRFVPVASAANTAYAATTARLFMSSVASGSPTTGNCWLLYEVFIAATTAASSTSNVIPYDIPLNFRIPAGYTLLATQQTALNANTATRVIAPGAGDY